MPKLLWFYCYFFFLGVPNRNNWLIAYNFHFFSVFLSSETHRFIIKTEWVLFQHSHIYQFSCIPCLTRNSPYSSSFKVQRCNTLVYLWHRFSLLETFHRKFNRIWDPQIGGTLRSMMRFLEYLYSWDSPHLPLSQFIDNSWR